MVLVPKFGMMMSGVGPPLRLPTARMAGMAPVGKGEPVAEVKVGVKRSSSRSKNRRRARCCIRCGEADRRRLTAVVKRRRERRRRHTEEIFMLQLLQLMSEKGE